MNFMIFRRVFVGEAFRAYISVGNSLTNAAVNDLKLRVSAGSVRQ